MKETAFDRIMRKSGKKPMPCKCQQCKLQCSTPCLGTPSDIQAIMDAGYADRLTECDWAVGRLSGLCTADIAIVAPRMENGACTFFRDGLCELHGLGLKPTEGKLSHHSITATNFRPSRSLAWLVVQEWTDGQKAHGDQIIDTIKQ